MEIPFSSTSACYEPQLALLREMAASLTEATTAIVASNLTAFEVQTERQRVFCQSWSALQTRVAKPVHTGPGPDANAGRLAEAATEVYQRLRLHAALLRRARRTVGIYCRVLATSGVTYVLPVPGARAGKL